MFLFFLIFFTVYSAVNYYLFIRGWQALQGIPSVRIIYLVMFLIAAFSYIAARSFSRILPMPIHDILTWIGSFWFAYILYVFIFIVLLDLVRLGNYFFDFYPQYVKDNYLSVKQLTFAAVFLVSSLIIFLGFLNTKTFQINSIDIEIPKRASALTELRVAVVSDLHLSTINNEVFLSKVVDLINDAGADLVLIPGDIVDDRSGYLVQKGIGPALRNLKAEYGVYASMGNHEFINGGNESERYLANHGIKILRDEADLVEGLFYVAGRDDTSKINFTGTGRKTLSEILQEVDPEYPLFLLDHTPFKLEEAAFNNVDLQVSGHTHHGQLYPLNFITSIVYEVSWGYKKKSNTHYYVSSGVGTWGPPVRTGSPSEIVLINISFK
jgi:uncharacterized protein